MDHAQINQLLDEIFQREKRSIFIHKNAPKRSYEERVYSLMQSTVVHIGRPKSPDLSEAERDKRTVFIQQLSHKVTSPILKEFCEKAGPVRQVKIVMDKITKRSKGIAYVEFREESSVSLAISLSGQKLIGIPIKVEMTETEKNRIAAEAANALKLQSGFSSEVSYRVLISNLNDISVDENMIIQLFSPFGLIEKIYLAKDVNNRPKGMCTIKFKFLKDAQAAADKMNGFTIMKKKLEVSLVRDSADYNFGDEFTLRTENMLKKIRESTYQQD